MISSSNVLEPLLPVLFYFFTMKDMKYMKILNKNSLSLPKALYVKIDLEDARTNIVNMLIQAIR